MICARCQKRITDTNYGTMTTEFEAPIGVIKALLHTSCLAVLEVQQKKIISFSVGYSVDKKIISVKEFDMQTPSIGLIVYYQAHGSPDGTHKSVPRAAMITEVFEDGTCQLTVFNPNGLYFNKTPFSETPKPGCWSWPTRV